MIKDENYLHISGWMVTRLKLKGNALLAFAAVYGFSQDGESEFTGSIGYLCEWLNVSRPTVSKALDELVERELLKKTQIERNRVKFNTYKANLPLIKKLCEGSKETLQGSKDSLQGGSKETLQGHKETLHNNTRDISNTENTKERDIDISKQDQTKKSADHPQEIVNAFNKICTSLPSVKKVSEARRKAIKARLNDFSYGDFITAFEKVQASDFLSGRSGKWQATFDWLTKESNLIKVLEGNYDNKAVAARVGQNGILIDVNNHEADELPF